MRRHSVVVLVAVLSLAAQAQQAVPAQQTPPPLPPPSTQPYYPQQAQPYYPQAAQPYAPQPAPRPYRIDDWNEGQPIPQGYHVVKRTRIGLVTAGAALFGASYFISILIATIGTDLSRGINTFWPQYIPVVGPFIQIGLMPLATVGVYCTLLGLAQAGGLAMFIAGFAAPKSSLIRDAYARGFMIVPVISPTSNGLAFSGRF